MHEEVDEWSCFFVRISCYFSSYIVTWPITVNFDYWLSARLAAGYCHMMQHTHTHTCTDTNPIRYYKNRIYFSTLVVVYKIVDGPFSVLGVIHCVIDAIHWLLSLAMTIRFLVISWLMVLLFLSLLPPLLFVVYGIGKNIN